MSSKEYEYVALIDESGEPGLRRVKPIDRNGSSEWLIIGAVVYARPRETQATDWANELLTIGGNRHTSQIHFKDLSHDKQKIVCRKMATYPLRVFVAVSNKKNMKGHKNPFAERVSEALLGRLPNYRWLYYWMTRILLEKVTHWVEAKSIREHGEPKKLKIIFSQRGGISYEELGLYYDVLREHDFAGTQHVTYDAITWSVMDRDLLEAFPANSRPDLSLPDIAASAFFAACDKHDRNAPPFPAPAKLLKPRVALGPKTWAGYGVKLMPSSFHVKMDNDQAEIFRFYGYPLKLK